MERNNLDRPLISNFYDRSKMDFLIPFNKTLLSGKYHHASPTDPGLYVVSKSDKYLLVKADSDISQHITSNCLLSPKELILTPGIKVTVNGTEIENSLANYNLHYPYTNKITSLKVLHKIKFPQMLRNLRMGGDVILIEPMSGIKIKKNDTVDFIRNLSDERKSYKLDGWEKIDEYFYSLPIQGPQGGFYLYGHYDNYTFDKSDFNYPPSNVFNTIAIYPNSNVTLFSQSNYGGTEQTYINNTNQEQKYPLNNFIIKSIKVKRNNIITYINPEILIKNIDKPFKWTEICDKVPIEYRVKSPSGTGDFMSTFYSFDEQEIDKSGCGNYAMVGISYEETENGISKKYTCDTNYDFTNQKEEVDVVRDKTNKGENKYSYLRFSTKECKNGPLVNMRVYRDKYQDKEMGHYEYRCGKGYNLIDKTEENIDSGKNNNDEVTYNDLSNMKIECPKGKILTEIGLSNGKFKYKCAKLEKSEIEGFSTIDNNNINKIFLLIIFLIIIYFIFIRK